MSTTLSTAFVASFDSEIKQAYQDKGKLRDRVRVKMGVRGSTHRFNLLGKGMATKRIPQTDIIPMGLVHSNQTATLEDWNAAEYTDIFDEPKTTVNERAELASSVASAISRREDQLIIDALVAASTALTVASSIGGTQTSLNLTKLRRAKRLLGDGGVSEDEELTYAGSYHSQEGLLGETQATSSDYNGVRALVNGEIHTFMGMAFRWIATRAEGGLDLTSNERMNFCFARSAIGLAEGISARTEVNYIPTKTSWLANGIFSAGSVDIEAAGIVELLTWEA